MANPKGLGSPTVDPGPARILCPECRVRPAIWTRFDPVSGKHLYRCECSAVENALYRGEALALTGRLRALQMRGGVAQ